MILNIGHRGFGVHAVENTLTAFKRAIEHKIDMVEFDVRLTKDDEVVVFHDPTLKRLSSVAVKVQDIDFESLRKFRIFLKREKSRETQFDFIPSLREVLELTRDKISLNIELKYSKRKSLLLVKKVLELVEEYGMSSRVILSSFSSEMLEMVSHVDDSIRCGYIFHSRAKKNMNSNFTNCSLYSIHPYKGIVNKRLIQQAKENTLKVLPWTVNSAKLMKKLIALGVDGIITNYPIKLANLLLADGLSNNGEANDE